MVVIIGFITVWAGVLGGYVAHHGNLAVLWQPTELVIIGGAAIGALLIQAPMSSIKMIPPMITAAIKGHEPSKEDYKQLLLCLFELVKTAKGNLLGLEAHVEKPEASEIFKKYPTVLANHHVMHFLCDTLKVQISSPVSPYDLDDLMTADIESAHAEELAVPGIVNKVGDACPGLGIVAAVLGVVITMGKLSAGKEAIGQSVAAALVGTFIGILLSYGFVGPLADKITATITKEGKQMDVVKAALVAFAKNCSPKVCLEFARRSVPPSVRPTFEEMDKGAAGQKAA
jgi:chemotaxis protein MotA